jgi:predicted RNA-binding Zn-ribbon protein involved in translation (DUF1610 family)
MEELVVTKTMNHRELDAYFNKQYTHGGYGGFCGYCGEGVEPLVNDDEATFGRCPYKGNHPNCGDHEMVFKEKTPDTFGAYEIYECKKCGWQESI